MEQELRSETEKWLERIRKERKNIKYNDRKGEDFLKNIDAYIEDAEHFMKNNDFVHAFEAVIWSWAILELALQLQILTKDSTKTHARHA